MPRASLEPAGPLAAGSSLVPFGLARAKRTAAPGLEGRGGFGGNLQQLLELRSPMSATVLANTCMPVAMNRGVGAFHDWLLKDTALESLRVSPRHSSSEQAVPSGQCWRR
jgi:hypothetical protein